MIEFLADVQSFALIECMRVDTLSDSIVVCTGMTSDAEAEVGLIHAPVAYCLPISSKPLQCTANPQDRWRYERA